MKHPVLFLKSFAVIFFVFVFSFRLQAQLANWRGELPVIVKNNSGSQMTNYQVPLKVNTQILIALGVMQASGNDIRFGSDCGGTQLYSYWLEGYMNTDSTKIWVRIPLIAPNDSARIYMFFGNPSAPAVSTLSVFSGPHSSTDSVMVASTNTVSNCQRGFRFSPNQDILVTHFGKRIPNSTVRYVTLFDFNTQAVVSKIQVSAGTSGQYNYDPLIKPIWLAQGTQYLLEIFNGAGDMYYYGVSSQVGQHITYYDMRYCNSCTHNTFPTSVLTNYHYGTPDLWYFVKENVNPAPTATYGLPADTNTPASPTGLTGIAGNQQALLRWNRSLEFDVIRYLVYRNTANNPGTAALIDSANHPDTSYTASGLNNGTAYYFWVRAADRFCIRRVSGFSNVASVTPTLTAQIEKVPGVFALHQNFPNPFNPVTRIKFDIPKGSIVRLIVYDIAGKEVEALVFEYLAPGYYETSFNAENLASGVYFYKIEAGSFTDKKVMVLLK